MRRISRIRQQPKLLLSATRSPSTSSPYAAAFPIRALSSTPTTRLQSSQRLWKGEPTTPSTQDQQQQQQQHQPPSDLAAYEAELAELQSQIPEALDESPARARPTSRIRASYKRTHAPTEDQAGAGYKPALSAEGLEEVGGYEGWWDREGHWGPESAYAGFAPAAADRVTDPAVLEVLLRQAVLEALAVRREYDAAKFVADWPAGDRAALDRALSLRFKVGEDGIVALRGNSNVVVKGLNTGKKALKKTRQQQQQQSEAGDANAAEAVVEEIEVEAAEYSVHGVISAEEAKELVGSWDPVWKDVVLSDPQVKFAVNKRVFQLTGHLLSDAKLARADTVSQVLGLLVRPPPAKKVVEVIEREASDLLDLPNVRVHARRVTPIDKEVEVGRWKLIKEELEKRDLPVTGHKDLEPHREATWVKGRV